MLILAVTVVAVQAGSPGTVEAATGDISVLNVGTCYTTNTDAFAVGACKDGQLEEQDDGEPADTAYNVGGRDSITKVDTVYATYAIDPKTSGDQPRAILKNSDLIKISIEDSGRDKRTGVLYAVQGAQESELNVEGAQATLIQTLGTLVDGLSDGTKKNLDADLDTLEIGVTNAATFDRGGNDTIGASGLYQFRLTGPGSTTHPMAPKDDGKVYWFGTTVSDDTTTPLRNLTDEFIELDEDLNSGTFESIAPWMRVSAQVPAGVTINVRFIYYQTSEEEDLIGGRKSEANDDDDDDASETDNELYPSGAEEPDFVDAEVKTLTNPDPDPLVLRVSADGRDPSMNLWLTEKSRFSGVYEGYARLTDADGDGAIDDDTDRDNWGLTTRDAAGSGDEEYAVIGVESGPVTITYKNSKGDTRTISITIDREPPSIQVDSPIDGMASTDDSPELIGTFTDGGGSGLREESFKVYADNMPDENVDKTPVWDLGVLGPVAGTDANRRDRGQVCVDALDADGNDGFDGECDGTTSAASLRAHYAGYTSGAGTFGIIYSSDVYRNTDVDADEDDEDDLKTADAEEFEDGDVNGEFDTIVRIDFDPGEANDGRYNHIVDIQAVVLDIAGNIGFSDSDPSGPIFIHDLGTASADRDKADKHNVIGVYSRHVYYLDDVDPYFEEDESATGFFPNSDGDQDHNNFGALIVFDGKVDPATVGVGTFEVSLDKGSDAAVVDVAVDGDKVYLLLEEELAPDATPQVALASGQSIADLAGNESTDRRLDGIELSDGILPVFTVTLSGGTGLNEDIDGEGPSEITKSQMKVSITANETIQGSPKFSVVCSNLTWGKAADENDVSTFASNRTGDKKSQDLTDAGPAAKHSIAGDGTDKASVPAAERTMCPFHVDAVTSTGIAGDVTTFFDVSETSALARPGNNWEYQWSNLSGDQAVEDGKLSVIVWGRDRSSYMRGSDRVFNYSAATTNFVYDTDLMTAWAQVKQESVERELVPDEGDDVFEVRPFVLLDFGDEGTTVDVTTFEVDGTDYTANLLAIEDNEFVWWPEPLSYGTYEVYVEANDAANNTGDHTYSFTVKARAPFVLDLLAGWNSISFPANPIDRALHAVFTNAAIDQVIGWNVTEPVSPWRLATRMDGVWTTGEEFATLNDVEARYGYWVHSTGFVTQAVDLAGKGDRATDGQPNPSDIPTDDGWNFVGIVDVDGDQTQDDAGETLRNSNNDPITAAEYLGNYTRAYTWDHINNTWDVVKNSEGITIGTGVWVYYTSDHDIAP